MTDYRALVLDFGGVLTTPMRRNGTIFEQSERLDPGAYFHALNENPDGIAVYAALEVGEATQQDWNDAIGEILGIDPTDLMRRALANLHPEPVMIQAVRDARASGLVTAVLSNSFGLQPFDIYDEFGVYDLFDVVVLSEQEKIRKPDPQIYQRLLTKLGVDGAQCVFVDDHQHNLPPARALGMTVIHHVEAAATVAELRRLGVLPATNSNEL